MRLNPPWAKFCLKLDSNRLLINFYDPIIAAGYTRRNDSIQIWKRIRSKKSIYINNQSKLIENDGIGMTILI